LGKVSRNGRHVSVTLIEGNPDATHPLKGNIVKIVALYGIALCEEFDKPELRFVEPLEALIPLYEAYGFSLETSESGVPYMCKRVSE
jgi:hypothetical protein